MAHLSDFKRGHIVGSRMAGARVTKIAELFGVARATVSKVLTVFEKEGLTSTLLQNSGRKQKLPDKDDRHLCRLLGRIPRIQLRKLQQSLMTIWKTQFPLKL